MARLLVQLKLRLLVNALRSSNSAKISFIISSTFAVLLAIVTFLVLAGFRGKSTSVELTSVIFTVFAFGWLIAPILVFGVDSTLDPATLALYPLRTRPLAVGLLAASFTGFWPLANVIGLLGVTVGLASGGLGIIVAVVAVVLEVLFCIALSRFATTSLASLLRSRRGRDLAAFLVIPLVALYEFFTQVVPKAASEGKITAASFTGFDSWMRWLPPGLAAHAIQDASDGRPGMAFARLGALAAVIVVFVWLWVRALGRALVTADTTTQSSRVRGMRLPLAGLGLRGAVAARVWLYQRREPLSLVYWALVAVITAAVSASSVFGPSIIPRSSSQARSSAPRSWESSTPIRPRRPDRRSSSRRRRWAAPATCVPTSQARTSCCASSGLRWSSRSASGWPPWPATPGWQSRRRRSSWPPSAPPSGSATCSLRRCPTRWLSEPALLCSWPRPATLPTGLAASSAPWRAPPCWPRR